MNITEIKGISSELLKKKTLTLYKAFIFPKEDMEMKVNTSIELLALTPEAAVKKLLQETPIEVFTKEMDESIDKMFDTQSEANEVDNLIRSFGEKMTIVKDKNGSMNKVSMKNTAIAFAVFKMDTEDLKSKSLVDGDEDFFKDDIIAITLSDKKYKIDVNEKKLVSFKLSINPTNEERKISGIELKEIK